MRKFFSFVAAVLFAGSMMAGVAEIKFTEAVAADDLAESASFTAAGSAFAAIITDPDNKMAIDANDCRFGTGESHNMYNFRLKTGGKSSSTKNFITLNIPEAGTLCLAVRTGSNSATDRNLVIKQGETELYNQAIVETMAIDVTEGENTVKVYPFVQVAVEAGEVVLSYPTNGLNFYALVLITEDVIPAVPQYEVAEAIAAGLADDTEILVRGVITKMEIKGKNFAKYGSVNIYVADATGAEGEFEFYNCYSLNADTFRTTTPAYDATSTAWAQLEEVVDGNGNTIQLGDTVIALGQYKLFNTTHELNTGCYLVDVKHAAVAPAEEINVTISSLTNPGQVFYADVIASYGYWDIYAYNDQYEIEISNISTTEAAGTYTIDDLDADYTYIVPAEGDTVHFTAGQVVLSITDGVVNVAGQLTGDDNNIYNINLTYKDPVAEQTVNVNITEGVLYDTYAAYGLYAVYGSAEDGTYVQLAIWAEAGFEGEFTEDDLDNEYVGSGLKDAAGNPQQIYAAAITVTPGAIEGDYTITADLLCYNNTLYKVTMKIGEEQQGINNVEAAVEAIKRIVNGQLVIEKVGKTYNVNGTVIR